MKMNIYEIYYIQDNLFSSSTFSLGFSVQCLFFCICQCVQHIISIFKVTSQSLPFINNFFNINNGSFCRYIGQNAVVGTRVSGGEIVLKLLSKTSKRMQIELWKQNKIRKFFRLAMYCPEKICFKRHLRKKSTDSVRRNAHNYK